MIHEDTNVVSHCPDLFFMLQLCNLLGLLGECDLVHRQLRHHRLVLLHHLCHLLLTLFQLQCDNSISWGMYNLSNTTKLRFPQKEHLNILSGVNVHYSFKTI